MGEAIRFHSLPAFDSTLHALLDEALAYLRGHHRGRIEPCGLLDRDRTNRTEQLPCLLTDGLVS